MIKYGIGILLAIGLFAFGFHMGATEHTQAFSDIKWTDVGALVVTAFGFSFGFLTYFQWLGGKRKEDAYLAAKKYITALEEVEEHLHELLLQYNHIFQKATLSKGGKNTSTKHIEHLSSIWNHLYQDRRNLYKAHRELEFWNVKLNPEFAEDYQTMKQLVKDISLLCSSLNHYLSHFIDNNKEDGHLVVEHKEEFDRLYEEIHQLAKKRVQSGFTAIFKFTN